LTWFVKSHGLGNDYIVLDGRETPFALTPANVRLICDRHLGVGSDGILLLMPSDQADFGVRIFNPDGSEAEKSGNGLRILAKAVYDHGYTDKTEFTVATLGGVVRARLQLEGRRVRAVSVEMGRATFRSGEIPVEGPDREVVDEPITVLGQAFQITAVSVGNPHCVVEVSDLGQVNLPELGPALETHPRFPRRTNVQFVQVLSPAAIRMLIWERGAGHTLASGSSACAAAAAMHRRGRVGGRVEVQMEGGTLTVEIGDDLSLTLTGPVEEVCTGQLSADLLARLE